MECNAVHDFHVFPSGFLLSFRRREKKKLRSVPSVRLMVISNIRHNRQQLINNLGVIVTTDLDEEKWRNGERENTDSAAIFIFLPSFVYSQKNQCHE